MLRTLALALISAVLCACGGNEETVRSFESVPGAPTAIWGLTFARNGAPVVFGGPTTFGDLNVSLQRGDLWQRVGTASRVSHGGVVTGAEGKVIAMANLSLFRLDDESAATWTPLGNPPADDLRNSMTPYGQDDSGAIYANGISTNGFGLMRWREGEPAWTEVVSQATFTTYSNIIVLRDGAVIWRGPGGIFRFQGDAVTQVVDCNIPELGYCGSGNQGPLAADAAGNLYFIDRITERTLHRWPAQGGEVERVAEWPGELMFLRGLQALPDGTVYLQASEDNGSSPAAVYELRPGASAFTKIASGWSDYHYVVRDRETIYGYGDGTFARGLVRSTR